MSKSIETANIDFGVVEEFQQKTISSVISNTGTERVNITKINSDNILFDFEYTPKRLEPDFPASSDIYFADADGSIQDPDTGQYCTSDCGYRKAGTTDANKKFTFSPDMASISVTAPLSTAKFELSDTITVNWTSNMVAQVNIVLESATGIKTYSGITASLGTYNCSIATADLGDFEANQEITITVEAVLGSAADTINVNTIATVAIDAISGVVAGEDYSYSGTSNGDEVELFYRESDQSPEDAWTSLGTSSVVAGVWGITGSIADAGTYDYKAEDTTDTDAYAQEDDVVVESGESTAKSSMDATCTADTPTSI